MKETLNTMQAADRLHKANVGFSHRGAQMLVEFIEDLEQETGEEIKMDPIAIHQDFMEYENKTEFKRENNIDMEDAEKELEEYAVTSTEGSPIIVRRF